MKTLALSSTVLRSKSLSLEAIVIVRPIIVWS